MSSDSSPLGTFDVGVKEEVNGGFGMGSEREALRTKRTVPSATWGGVLVAVVGATEGDVEMEEDLRAWGC